MIANNASDNLRYVDDYINGYNNDNLKLNQLQSTVSSKYFVIALINEKSNECFVISNYNIDFKNINQIGLNAESNGVLIIIDCSKYEIGRELETDCFKNNFVEIQEFPNESLSKTDHILVIQDGIDFKLKFAQNLPGRIRFTITKNSTNFLLNNTATYLAHKFPESIVAVHLPIALKSANLLVCLSLEGFNMTYDISRHYKKVINGQVKINEFRRYVALRITRGTMGFFGGFCGSFVGQLLIPIPIFGALVGGFIGSIIGSFIGHVEGLVLGDVLDNIDFENI